MSDIWSQLKYFKKTENWGDPEKMDKIFLKKLDNFRHVIGYPCALTAPAYTKAGHAEKSFHYVGLAADCRFVNPVTRQPLSLVDHIIIALRAPFGGVGIYTWSPNGPFLHFDDRPIVFDRKIWICEKEGDYANLSADFLRKHLNLPAIVRG